MSDLRLALGLAVVFTLTSSGCREQPKSGASPASSASALDVGAPLISRELSGETSFDLVALPDGAALAVGEPKGGLLVMLLDRQGVPRAAPISLPEARQDRVGEVSLASVGSRLALAWVTRLPGGEAASFAALGDAATRAFAPPLALGPLTLEPGAKSGYVQVAAGNQGEFVVLRRGRDEPCASDSHQKCAAFGFRELSTTGSEPRGLPMSVPAACSRALAGFAAVDDRWHYGFCSQAEGRPVTTHFMRQLEPFYVEVHRSFEGCTALGASTLGSDALLLADCATGRRGLRVGAMRQATREIDLSQVDATCEGGRPVLRAVGLELRLETPRDRLGWLLPRRFGKGNVRGVWTGSHLLIATSAGGSVSVRGYACRGSLLLGP